MSDAALESARARPTRGPVRDLLVDCTLFVRGELPGTGFFVAKDEVLTCTHVVGNALNADGAKIELRWQGESLWVGKEDIVDQLAPEGEDAVLLRVRVNSHPCVRLDGHVLPGQQLWTHGFPRIDRDQAGMSDDLAPRLEGFTQIHEGVGPDYLLKFKESDVIPGYSGAPLLNEATQGVCGMVRETRGRGMGGRAIPVSILLSRLPGLEQRNREFLRFDRRWELACGPQPRPALRAGPAPFWPHLSNRWPQSAKLYEALQHHHRTAPRRPFVIISLGDQREMHEGFRDRLAYADLAHFLGRRNPREPASVVTLAPTYDNPATLETQIVTGLMSRLECSRENVPEALAASASTTLLYATVTTSEWDKNGTRMLDAFFSFWSKWPNIATDSTLIVLLSVKFDCEDADAEVPEWAYPERVAEVRSALEVLAKHAPEKFPAIGYVVLPEFEPIRSLHAKQVIELPQIRPFLPTDARPLWEEHVDRLWGSRNRLSMQHVAPKLREILTDLRKEIGL